MQLFLVAKNLCTYMLTKNNERERKIAMKVNKTYTQNEKNHKHKFFLNNKNERWETYWAWKGKVEVHKKFKGKEIENASTSIF